MPLLLVPTLIHHYEDERFAVQMFHGPFAALASVSAGSDYQPQEAAGVPVLLLSAFGLGHAQACTSPLYRGWTAVALDWLLRSEFAATGYWYKYHAIKDSLTGFKLAPST